MPLVNTYKVCEGNSDLDGDDFTAHVNALDSSDPAWNGRLTTDDPGNEIWWPDGDGGLSIGGKVMGTGSTFIMRGSGGVGWLLRLTCCNDETCAIFVWEGTKSTGATPVGTYARTTASMSDNRQTLDVVEA